MGRFVKGTAVAGEIAPAEGIHQDVNNIGLFHLLRKSISSRPEILRIFQCLHSAVLLMRGE